MSKHTPGPWQITRAKGLPHAIVAPHPEIGTIPVATVVVANDHEANALLLAAAPEMLEALKALCDHEASYVGNEIRITCNSHGDAIGRMRIAREAIAKAST